LALAKLLQKWEKGLKNTMLRESIFNSVKKEVGSILIDCSLGLLVTHTKIGGWFRLESFF
jgi:hypothetical protein